MNIDPSKMKGTNHCRPAPAVPGAAFVMNRTGRGNPACVRELSYRCRAPEWVTIALQMRARPCSGTYRHLACDLLQSPALFGPSRRACHGYDQFIDRKPSRLGYLRPAPGREVPA